MPAFSTSALDRLAAFVRGAGEEPRIEPLTPDASAREYFRIGWRGNARIACVYPEPFGEDLPFLDTTRLYLNAGMPVAEIIEIDGDSGIVIQEDLGSYSLADELEAAGPARRQTRIREAVFLIADIQKATGLAYESGSLASRLRFDIEKLSWELDFFLTHYFVSLRKTPLKRSLEESVRSEFSELAETLEGYSVVLTHRDYHAANLLVGPDGKLKIIDHQDSRLGSSAYDLVSLLLDRITEQPSESTLGEYRRLLLDLRRERSLPAIAEDDFEREFDLVSVQRCLKAIGTFSNQAGNFGRTHYTRFIPAMFGVVKQSCDRLQRFPAVREMVLTSGWELDR